MAANPDYDEGLFPDDQTTQPYGNERGWHHSGGVFHDRRSEESSEEARYARFHG